MKQMAKWIASLSDGRTIEEKELFVEGGVSPYTALLKLVDKDNVTITGFRIQVNGITYTAPSNAKLAKFPSEVPVKPTHRIRATLDSSGKTEQYYGYYFVLGEHQIYQWIDSKNGDSWIQTVKAEAIQ